MAAPTGGDGVLMDIVSEHIFTIHHGNCRSVMRSMHDCSVDAIVTDPPYGLSREPDPVQVMRAWVDGKDYVHKSRGFMGQKWDAFVPSPSYFKESLRVLKPGGYALVFAGSRTQDWMAMSLRFAGFEIVDTIMWVYSQGMPKSHNIGKAIDKTLGATRNEVVGRYQPPGMHRPWNLKNAADEREVDVFSSSRNNLDILAPATIEAAQWEGWGTQLKPAYEPILLVRKPLDGTFARNVLAHGVGGINIDACRVHADDATGGKYTIKRFAAGASVNKTGEWKLDQPFHGEMKAGRWPANFVHDGSDEVVDAFPFSAGQQGDLRGHSTARVSPNGIFGRFGAAADRLARGDEGSAARFFYCAKPSKQERHLGTGCSPKGFAKHGSTLRHVEEAVKRGERDGNTHPTLKPITLMEWLCKMICPPDGVILDQFCGSGTTGMAALKNGFRFIGIERDAKYVSVANARCAYAQQRMTGQESKRAEKRRTARTVMRKYKKHEQMPLFMDGAA